MRIQWTPHQQQLRDDYAAFGKKVAETASSHWAAQGFDQQHWDELSAMGIWRLSGTDWWDLSAALEGLASTCADGGFLLSCISHASLLHAIGILGTDKQKERYIPALQQGMLSTTAIAERSSGTDVPHVKTSANELDGGWLLTGEKWNIAHAQSARLHLVVGRIPSLGRQDITLFLIDANKPGISAGRPDDKMGNRSIPTGPLQFTAVPVDKEDILGTPGKGLQTLGKAMALGRVYYGLCASMLLQRAFEEVWKMTVQRSSFGKPLHHHQYVQGKLTHVKMRIEQSRYTAYGALEQVLDKHPEAIATASIAKLGGCQHFRQGMDELMSLAGSNGYHTGLLSRLAQDSIGFLTVGGTEETQRMGIYNTLSRVAFAESK